MTTNALHHFSEDPSIVRFVPHVPRTNPEHRRAVWAIDAEHAPLYWFPRDCPRVTIWPLRAGDVGSFQTRLATTASRVHAIESGWLQRMRSTPIYRYDFEPDGFYPWEEANGQWIAESEVVPVVVTPMGDLLEAHVHAAIELRIVRMLNAQPRDET